MENKTPVKINLKSVKDKLTTGSPDIRKFLFDQEGVSLLSKAEVQTNTVFNPARQTVANTVTQDYKTKKGSKDVLKHDTLQVHSAVPTIDERIHAFESRMLDINRNCSQCSSVDLHLTTGKSKMAQGGDYPDLNEALSGGTGELQNNHDKQHGDQNNSDLEIVFNKGSVKKGDQEGKPEGVADKGNNKQGNTPLSDEDKELIQLKKLINKAEAGSVQQMFLELKLEMKLESMKTRKIMSQYATDTALLKEDIRQVKDDNKDLHTRLDQLQGFQNDETTKLTTAKADIKVIDSNIETMINIASKQDMQLEHLSSYNTNLESISLRPNLLISGLEEKEDENSASLKEMVTNFFSQTLKINSAIGIRLVTRLGNPDRLNRIVQVVLANPKDKGTIYKHTKNLKVVKNSYNKPYFVNDQLPLEKVEQQRRYSAILKKNKTSPSEKLNMVIKKGRLYINNSEFTPKVQAPTVQEIVKPDNPIEIESIKLIEGSRVRNNRCRFVAMSQEIRSIQDVRAGYIKARRKHSKA